VRLAGWQRLSGAQPLVLKAETNLDNLNRPTDYYMRNLLWELRDGGQVGEVGVESFLSGLFDENRSATCSQPHEVRA
jgi:hypothetical protein